MRAIFALEKKGRTINAYEITPFGGLQQTGATILELHRVGCAASYLDCMNPQFNKHLENCTPEMYRRTRTSGKNDKYPEFSYVLRGNVLAVYHFGRWIFETTPEQAGKWARVLLHLDQYANKYLYDEKNMRYDMSRWDFMFQQIRKDGFEPGEHVRLVLERDGCDFSTGHEYVALKEGTRTLMWFTMSEGTYGWMVFAELPFGRVRILNNLCSEQYAFSVLCRYCRIIPPKQFVNAKWMADLYRKLQDEDPEKAEKILREQQGEWFLMDTSFSIEEMVKHLKGEK